MRDLIPYELEYLFSYAADCDPNFEVYDPSIFGGFRLTGYIVGGWAHDAIVYDEKPLTFKQSWKARRCA